MDKFRRKEKAENVRVPLFIQQIQNKNEATKKQRKQKYKKLKHLERQKPISIYRWGPFDIPLCNLISSRWTPLRTHLPLAKNWETWRIAWRFWRRADTYLEIKEHIEKYGMQNPIALHCYLNYDPVYKQSVHKSCWFEEEAPLFIVKNGNERLLMAMFEWNWKTIPAIIGIRDYGFDPLISKFLKAINSFGVSYERKAKS